MSIDLTIDNIPAARAEYDLAGNVILTCPPKSRLAKAIECDIPVDARHYSPHGPSWLIAYGWDAVGCLLL
jgi:hypothetical protein